MATIIFDCRAQAEQHFAQYGQVPLFPAKRVFTPDCMTSVNTSIVFPPTVTREDDINFQCSLLRGMKTLKAATITLVLGILLVIPV